MLGLELSDATFGIVGLGRIGRRYAELVRPLAGTLLYTARSPKPDAEAPSWARATWSSQSSWSARTSSASTLRAAKTTRHLIGSARSSSG